MRKIKVSSPTRVDLAGGTLDLWPLYNFLADENGGATTVNLAIDIWTTVEIEEHSDPTESTVELISEDLGISRKFSNLQECLRTPDARLRLLQVQLEFWHPKQGFRLRTKSESPVGGGIGGSSSLTVSLLKAFDQLSVTGSEGSRFSSINQLVHVAHNLEAEVLNTPTGTQDYYPAASGGLNILNYSVAGISQKVLPVQGQEIEKHFLLVYTGKSHHSGINNFEVMIKAVQKDVKVCTALQKIKKIAQETAQACERGEYGRLPALFNQEYEARVHLADSFSSPEIEKLREVSLQAGAEAVKICGAGGGGCVLVWVPPDRRQEVVSACERNGFQVLRAKPVAPLS